jgi:1,4-dihydroxy-2-naphthoyl-CoA hydrolase
MSTSQPAGATPPGQDRKRRSPEELLEMMPLAAHLGMEAVSASTERVRLRLRWAPRNCTSGGVLHGGAIMALADTAGGLLAFLNLPDDAAGTTTTDSQTRFLAAVREGHVEATSRLLHKGRTVIAIDTEVRDASGRLVARTSQAQMVLGAR